MPFANGALLDYCLFISCIFMTLIGPNLMFPGISNGTHCTLFKMNIIGNMARYIALQSLRELEDSGSLDLIILFNNF